MELRIFENPDQKPWVPPSFRGQENPPTFQLQKLGRRRRAEIKDQTIELSIQDEVRGGNKVKFCTATVDINLVVSSICGWSNIKNAEGKPYKFSASPQIIESVLDNLEDDDYDDLVAEVNPNSMFAPDNEVKVKESVETEDSDSDDVENEDASD